MENITATCPKCQEQVDKLGPAYITIDRVRYIICDKCAAHDDKKQHWTQTPAGREKMRQFMLKRHKEKK